MKFAIPHQRLLRRLDFCSVRSNTKQWIASFLTKHLQRVCVNGKSSDWRPVLSGTPQGTVLGPHLFLIYINDIHENVTSMTRLFADDCWLYRLIKLADDKDALQKDLDTMVEWLQQWGMQFNPSKCETMSPGRGNQAKHYLIYCIRCSRCQLIYIGETKRRLGDRFAEDLRSVRKNLPELPVAQHFNSPSHSQSDLSVLGLLHCQSEQHRKLEEQHLIFRLGSLRLAGMNIEFSQFC
ncbi:uncharacterized protein LOC129700131 [Leucoraja erinacea]|uniref:uncharacterized protein LOC129700131 n=1 Tax=Leucoraja erinaceus TaxID=7782 RepID=UPI002456982F|nr:uncharacterized protein LOC129700131 [Leucoraja erinacea]